METEKYTCKVNKCGCHWSVYNPDGKRLSSFTKEDMANSYADKLNKMLAMHGRAELEKMPGYIGWI